MEMGLVICVTIVQVPQITPRQTPTKMEWVMLVKMTMRKYKHNSYIQSNTDYYASSIHDIYILKTMFSIVSEMAMG